VRRTVPPSVEIEEQIDRLLAVGVGENPRESLSELAKLGARLIIQRAVEDEFDAWLGRARYETPAALFARRMPGDRHRPVDHDHVTGGLPRRNDRTARDDHVIGSRERAGRPKQEHDQRDDQYATCARHERLAVVPDQVVRPVR
jgi:hypothetical protein